MERVNVLIDVKPQQLFVQILEQSSPKHPALHVHVPVDRKNNLEVLGLLYIYWMKDIKSFILVGSSNKIEKLTISQLLISYYTCHSNMKFFAFMIDLVNIILDVPLLT